MCSAQPELHGTHFGKQSNPGGTRLVYVDIRAKNKKIHAGLSCVTQKLTGQYSAFPFNSSLNFYLLTVTTLRIFEAPWKVFFPAPGLYMSDASSSNTVIQGHLSHFLVACFFSTFFTRFICTGALSCTFLTCHLGLRQLLSQPHSTLASVP